MLDSKVLLVSAYGPYETVWGESVHDIGSSRLARGQGAFNMKGHGHYWGLHLIAENINCRSTVLEDPHWEEFEAEVAKGYDYVGIQIKSLRTPKVARMVRHIKETSPETKLIMGGYGVSSLYDPVPCDKEGAAKYITENADYFCREEGVRFFRKILGDDPVDRPITQEFLPFGGSTFPGLEGVIKVRAPNITVSLGCPNGCDFCNTSAFFNQKKIYLASPKETYGIMKHYQKRLKRRGVMFSLFDEDFALDKDYVTELGKLIRSDESTWGFGYFCFGSIKSLSQYTFEELAENGMEGSWVGVESFIPEVVDTHNIEKRGGDRSIEETFKGLHSHGIGTTASMIIGFDFHTPENIQKDLDSFVKLEPVNYQIAPLTPCPGTKLFREMQESGRLYQDYEWKDVHIWKDDMFKLKNFERGALRKWYDMVHVKLFEENGPSQQRIFDVSMQAYKTLRQYKNKFLNFRSGQKAKVVRNVYPMLEAAIRHSPGPIAKEKAIKLKEEYKKEFGDPTPLQNQQADFISEHIARRKIELEEEEKVVKDSYDPPVRWTYYNGPGQAPMVKRSREQKEPIPYENIA